MSTIRPIRKIIQFFVDKPLQKDTVLNKRYQIKGILGLGSFGIVYKCNNLLLEKTVSVKQLRPSRRKKQRDRMLFEQEAKILQYLNHECIPSFIEFFSIEDQVFYVMDFIKGENVAYDIFEKKEKFTEEEALLFVRQIADVVGYLHSNDIYHGDLRIPNIMIQNNKPILIDLGLAHCLNERIVPAEFNVSKKFKNVHRKELQEDDYYDLGDLLLYLLYTTYEGKTKKALPWTEELTLQKETSNLLCRLLGIEKKHSNIDELLADFDSAINQFTV